MKTAFWSQSMNFKEVLGVLLRAVVNLGIAYENRISIEKRGLESGPLQVVAMAI